MLILSIDGALGPLTAAVLDTATGLTTLESAAPRDALEDGLRAVDAALRAAGVEPQRLDRMAVTVGPGGFTGLRIALTYAKSLAFALRVPLVGVSSYDALTPPEPLAEPSLTAVRGRARAACVRLRADGREERHCDDVPALALWIRERVSTRRPLTVFGALEELAPALAQAGLLLERPEPVEAPALRAARLGAVATPPFEGVHGVQPDYGERPHTTVAQ